MTSKTSATWYRWNDMPKEQLSDTLARRLITGDQMMLAHVYLNKGCVVPKHSHHNEQLTYILEGALKFTLGENQDEEVIVRAGEVLHCRRTCRIWRWRWRTRSTSTSSPRHAKTGSTRPTPISVARLVIAAPASGAGKTTIAVGLMRAFVARGLSVAPFKIGPDYIDPTHHRAAAGRPSRSLDTWMLSSDAVLGVFARGTVGADIAIVEGVMGLFDGRAGPSPNGSTAEVATLLQAPIILVLDARAMAQTAGAIVLGMTSAVPGVRIAGVILNRVAGEAHAAMCRTAIEDIAGVPVLGWLPRDPAISIPERHLGLFQAHEQTIEFEKLTEHIDLDALLHIARSAPPLDITAPSLAVVRRKAVIGVARDAAFSFYYEDSLDLLRAHGAEIKFFSPLSDAAPPDDAGLLYFGGGYPELHADALAANRSMLESVRAFKRPIYAECGGLMYLCEGLVGLIPAVAEMSQKLTMGYRELEALTDSPLAIKGQRLRGHEFHYSTITMTRPTEAAYRLPDGRTEGVIARNVLASYVHVHLGSDPRLAERLVHTAERGGLAREMV